jgi:hypothetical protein
VNLIDRLCSFPAGGNHHLDCGLLGRLHRYATNPVHTTQDRARAVRRIHEVMGLDMPVLEDAALVEEFVRMARENGEDL